MILHKKHTPEDINSSYCIYFALDNPLPYESLALTQIYNGCKVPFKLLDDIALHVPTEDGFKTLIEDLGMNFYFYFRHTVQVNNNNNAIKNVMSKMNGD